MHAKTVRRSFRGGRDGSQSKNPARGEFVFAGSGQANAGAITTNSRSGSRQKRDCLKRDNFAERKFFVGPPPPPMVMALRRKVESFHVRFQPLEQSFKWFRRRRAREAALRGQNCSGHGAIIHFA